MPGAQSRQGPLELERLLDGLTNELLEDRLPPRLQRALAEAAGEALDAGEADAADLDGVSVEHRDAAVAEDALDLIGLLRLVVVVTEHGHDRDFRERQLPHEALRLVGRAGIRQIATEGENVRPLGDRADDGGERPRRHCFGAMEIAHRGDAHAIRAHRTGASASRRALNPARPSRSARSGSSPDMNA